MRSRNPGYRPGDHWVMDERTGFAIRKSEAREEWTGIITHKNNWESRHPQDFVRSREDNQAPRGLNRSESEDFFVSVDFSSSFIASDSGTADAQDVVYANALAGANTNFGNDGVNLLVGQELFGGTFFVYQGFIRFDLGTFTGSVDTITNASLQVGIVLNQSVVDFNVEVAGYIWGEDTSGADFRPQTVLQAFTIPGSFATSAIVGNGTTITFDIPDIKVFANSLNLDPDLPVGTVADFALFSSRNRNGDTPTVTAETVFLAGHNHPNEALRPILTIDTGPKRSTPIPSSSFNQETL